MNDHNKSEQQLLQELVTLRRRIAKLETERLPLRQETPKIDHLEQLRAIFYLGDMISRAKSATAIYENAINAVRITLQADAVAISLFTEGRAYLGAYRGLSDNFTQKVVVCLPWSSTEKYPTPLFVPNIKRAPIAPQLRDIIIEEQLEAIGFVPLIYQERLIGHLIFAYHQKHQFYEEELWLTQTIAGHIALAIERQGAEAALTQSKRLYEQTQQELAERKVAEEQAFALNGQLLTLLYAGATIASSLDLQFVLNTFAKEIVDLLEAQGCVISRWDQATNEVTVIARYSPQDWWPERALGTVYSLTNLPLSEWVLQKRRAELLTQHQADLTLPDRAYLQENKIKTLLILPMEVQGRAVGLVEVMDGHSERAFTTGEIAFTQLLANQAATGIENARLYAQAQQEIADRKRAELALRRITTRNQAILDAIPDALFFLSRSGEILNYKVSKRDDLLLGLTEEALLGQKLGDALQMSPAMIEALLQCIGQALDTRTVQIFEYQQPLLLNNIEVFEARLVPSAKNEILAIIRNITERKQTERQIIHTERLAALGRLAAALAHEINNPLQAMQSNLDLMLKYPLKPGESEQYLRIIHRQIERVTEISRYILNYARPQLSPSQPISVVEQIEQVLVLARKQLEEKDIQVSIDSQPNLPYILAAPQQLTQIFLNLVINAIEAIQAEQGRLNITVYRDGSEIATSFTSNGPAIPAEILPHIFEPFFTTKPEGNGLGLWVSHSLVQQYSGSLTVENLTKEQGVVFTVRLPFSSTL